ncbi:hypothetical protein PL263_09760 [Methylomonas sp. EFPC3]|uniref:hypothetical protein n=1 Tax=Methylomonas sp. EFPC3 TaxID=3021710 RepID=UPI002417DDE7|nr:hypothetical protein [Methylomonas sp. EFPC3]WFP52293.1 hypothetical protein PL263_09760 [Methylomonas sp. EFPC3]
MAYDKRQTPLHVTTAFMALECEVAEVAALKQPVDHVREVDRTNEFPGLRKHDHEAKVVPGIKAGKVSRERRFIARRRCPWPMKLTASSCSQNELMLV